MRAAWFACVVAAGCADPVIAMQLEMPTSVAADFDTSCITAVDVMAFSAESLATSPDISSFSAAQAGGPICSPVANAKTIAQLVDQLRGQIDLPLPPGGLAAVALRARTGACDGSFGMGLVYGAGIYTPNASHVAVPVVANISCASSATIKVQPIDMFGLIGDPAHACPTLDTSGDTGAIPGVIRPTRLTTATSGPALMLFEADNTGQPLGTDRTATLASFAATAPDACIAVAYSNLTADGSGCVNRGLPTLCASDPNAVELPIATITKIDAPDILDSGLVAQYGNPALGFVWEKTATTKAPLANATVTVKDPTRATVVYLDIVNGNLKTTTGTKTTSAGVYFVYTNGISALTIAAPAHNPQRILVGATGQRNIFDATALAVLTPQ